MVFELTFRFFFNAHGVVPDLIALRLDLAAPTRRVALFFFTYNILAKRHSGILAFGFLTGVDVLGYIGLLSVNHSVVES